jgi:hypothetical protein
LELIDNWPVPLGGLVYARRVPSGFGRGNLNFRAFRRVDGPAIDRVEMSIFGVERRQRLTCGQDAEALGIRPTPTARLPPEKRHKSYFRSKQRLSAHYLLM